MIAFQAPCDLSLGEAQLLAGHLDEAHALAERALAHAREHQERGNQTYALRLLGDIAVHRTPPNVDAAAAHYHQAQALAEELGMRPCRRTATGVSACCMPRLVNRSRLAQHSRPRSSSTAAWR